MSKCVCQWCTCNPATADHDDSCGDRNPNCSFCGDRRMDKPCVACFGLGEANCECTMRFGRWYPGGKPDPQCSDCRGSGIRNPCPECGLGTGHPLFGKEPPQNPEDRPGKVAERVWKDPQR